MTGPALAEVLRLFGAYRLLTFDLDPITRGPTVEVAHEALLREWPRLASWIDEQRARAVLSLRVDRAYCAENRWQGRFSVGGYGRFLQN